MKNEIFYGLWSVACLIIVLAQLYSINCDPSYMKIFILIVWVVLFILSVVLAIEWFVK